ncbi:hypothetical protein [Salsipaludibacter albus]|uniref:hypothetical protein n=1 Tax=Salsipaludibacter albus TaxID=2849650 RepID=UPI001EE46CD3|nr:hypothetical protein [Salsipaludibacter albus]MBY5161914.1 hypothetical protein [Salsipaludibacter albus]
MHPVLPPLERWAQDRGVVAAVAIGFVVGAGWGIVARAWMRLISEHPEFSWSGTGYIVVAPALIGAVVALAHVAMARHWRAAMLLRVPAVLVHVLLGMGAGALLIPTIAFGSIAAARDRFGLALRLGLAVLVLALGIPIGIGDGSSAVGVGILAAGVVVVVVLVSGWRTRVVLASLAILVALGVSVSVLVAEIPLVRGALGALLFLPLVAVPTLSAASVLRPRRHRPTEPASS